VSPNHVKEQLLLFKQLPGLPGEGSMPVQFSSTGRGTHREGFVVEFHPDSSKSWVGNFQPGSSTFSTILLHPDGKSVIVISSGQGYCVDADSKELLSEFGGSLTGFIAIPGYSMLVLSDDIYLHALLPSGFAWQTKRISWDGIQKLALSADTIVGEAYDAMSDTWMPFSVSLDNGRVNGGAF
jgi:hypothetical protein